MAEAIPLLLADSLLGLAGRCLCKQLRIERSLLRNNRHSSDVAGCRDGGSQILRTPIRTRCRCKQKRKRTTAPRLSEPLRQNSSRLFVVKYHAPDAVHSYRNRRTSAAVRSSTQHATPMARRIGRSRWSLIFPAGRLQTSECGTGLPRFPVTADCPSRGSSAATVRRSDPAALHARRKLPRRGRGCRIWRFVARPYVAEIRTYYDRARS
jgi:hypothetical protein